MVGSTGVPPPNSYFLQMFEVIIPLIKTVPNGGSMRNSDRYSDRNSMNYVFHEEESGLFQSGHYGCNFYYSRPPSYESEVKNGSGANLIDSLLYNLLFLRDYTK